MFTRPTTNTVNDPGRAPGCISLSYILYCIDLKDKPYICY